MKKITFTLLITIIASFTINASETKKLPKNVIMIVGDGMGPAYTTAYRYFKDDPNTPNIESTIFDDILLGRASTYPAPVSGLVTDSAASGTALATGHKTYNKAIGVDVDGKPLQSVLEYAKSIGKSTGLVVTSQINHATPASYTAHAASRKMYDEIANQYFDSKINNQHKVDVMMGGGVKYFKREDRNLIEEFKASGYQVIDDYKQLSQINNDKVLGLFADVGLPWALDEQPHRLKNMAMAAIDRLDNNNNGFFMLIEGSQIDWGGHANDIASAMAELDDLAVTIKWLRNYVDKNPDTLVIITADHSTGGFTIGANGDYAWHPEFIRHLKSSPEEIAKKQIKNSFDPQVISNELGFTLTDSEIATLNTAFTSSKELLDKKPLYNAIKKVIDIRTNTGWTTGEHTAVDVPVFAFGSNKHEFVGQIDNTDIAKKIFKLLGK